MDKRLSRREFLQVSAAATIAGVAAFSTESTTDVQAAKRKPFQGKLCFFSKPVPQLNWNELAQYTKQAGFDGIDLTVRPKGHVLPERVATDLPRAVAAIRAEGLEVPMITTELLRADDPTADPILKTASELSIPFVKPGYYRYKFVNILEELEQAGHKFRGLVELAGKHGIQVGYHNHPGYIGAPVWDMARVIEPLDPRWCGFYFDLGQATIDGAASAWRMAANLVIPRLKMVAAKDFIWKQAGPHQWHAKTCPLGQGMAHWGEFLHTLAQSNFHGPISLQQEFSIPGVADSQGIAVSRAAVPQVMAAAKEGLDSLKSLLHDSYEEG